MAASGNPTQWGDNFPPQELLEEDIDSNRLFVYVVNGQSAGRVAFILGADPTYQVIGDGAWLNDALPMAPSTGWPLPARARGWLRRSLSGVWSTARVCGRTPMPTPDHAASAGKERLYALRHHPCGGRNAPHRLPEAGPDPAAQLSQKHSIAPLPRGPARGRGCFFFVVKTAKLYFMQIQFSGRKNKSSQKLENEREKCLEILPLLGRLCYNDTCS